MSKIVHLTSVHPRYDVRIFHKECMSLSKNWEVALIVADNKGDEICQNIKIYDVGKENGRFNRIFKTTKKVYQKALQLNGDIYHFHDPELLPVGKKLAQKGKKVIYDSHEDMPALLSEKEWITPFLRPLVAKIFTYYERYCIKKFAAVVTVTPLMTQRFQKSFSNVCQITNFPIDSSNFIDHRKWDYSVCFAGGISKQWMHENILKAITEIDNITYRLAGISDSENYFNQLKEMSVWNKVEYHGKIPHQDVHDFIQYSTAAIALNDYVANVGFKEGSLGNTKLFEYMQAGIPVICTDFHQWKQIVKNENCGICVNPHNIDEIKNAIEFLLNNPEQARQMGENGRKAVTEKYNWKTQENKLFSLYGNLL